MKLFPLVLLLACTTCFGQTKDPISVNIEIIGKGNIYDTILKGREQYFIRFEITNNEDTTLPVTTWTCSWDNNWRTDSDSVYILGWGCDGNYPETINLPPGKSLVSYAGIYGKSTLKNKVIRLGFANCSKEFIDYGITFLAKSRKPEGKVYWSNEVQIKSEPYYYDATIK